MIRDVNESKFFVTYPVSQIQVSKRNRILLDSCVCHVLEFWPVDGEDVVECDVDILHLEGDQDRRVP